MAIKILVFSDSHGKSGLMNKVVLIESPDLIIHLGDGVYDIHRVKAEYPGIPAATIRGNCDLGAGEPASRSLNLDGLNVFMTHGHIYGVKSGYSDAIDAAKKADADILLFGHTHHPMYEMSGTLHIFNPGSVFGGSYGLIEIKNGIPFFRLKSM